MKHFDEDILLKFSIETLEENKREEVAEHLAVCSKCRNEFQQIKNEVEMIGSFELPKVKLNKPGLQRKIDPKLFLRRAAMILVFAAAAYLSVVTFQQSDVKVIGQTFIPRSPSISITQPVHCQEIDLR